VYCVREGGQREWFVKDLDLLLPEYIIEVKYSTNTALPTDDHITPCAIPESTAPIHPRLAMLDEHTLLEKSGVESLSSIKV